MFKVLKNGKQSVRTTSVSYETARQHVRKLIRRVVRPADYFWTTNPPIRDYGYSIKKV